MSNQELFGALVLAAWALVCLAASELVGQRSAQPRRHARQLVMDVPWCPHCRARHDHLTFAENPLVHMGQLPVYQAPCPRTANPIIAWPPTTRAIAC